MPLEAAAWSGVYAFLSLQSTSAPLATNNFTTSKWPETDEGGEEMILIKIQLKSRHVHFAMYYLWKWQLRRDRGFNSLTHVGCPVDGSPVLLVKCINVGSSGQQQLHHLSHKRKLTRCWHVCECPCVCLNETHLYMSTEGSVVQSSASRPVRHVDVAKQRDQSLSTAYCLVASCNMERRLPVLVTGVNICTVLQQHCHCILDGEGEWFRVCRQRLYF